MIGIYNIFHDDCLETEGVSLPVNGLDETTASSVSVPLVGPIRNHNAQVKISVEVNLFFYFSLSTRHLKNLF